MSLSMGVMFCHCITQTHTHTSLSFVPSLTLPDLYGGAGWGGGICVMIGCCWGSCWIMVVGCWGSCKESTDAMGHTYERHLDCVFLVNTVACEHLPRNVTTRRSGIECKNCDWSACPTFGMCVDEPITSLTSCLRGIPRMRFSDKPG